MMLPEMLYQADPVTASSRKILIRRYVDATEPVRSHLVNREAGLITPFEREGLVFRRLRHALVS